MQYEKSFKEQAVKLFDEIGIKAVANQLGIPYYTIPLGEISEKNMEQILNFFKRTKNNKEFLDLATYAFHKPKTKERAKAFDKLLEFSTPYGHYENQKLTSMVIDSHFNVYWKNQEVLLQVCYM